MTTVNSYPVAQVPLTVSEIQWLRLTVLLLYYMNFDALVMAMSVTKPRLVSATIVTPTGVECNLHHYCKDTVFTLGASSVAPPLPVVPLNSSTLPSHCLRLMPFAVPRKQAKHSCVIMRPLIYCGPHVAAPSSLFLPVRLCIFVFTARASAIWIIRCVSVLSPKFLGGVNRYSLVYVGSKVLALLAHLISVSWSIILDKSGRTTSGCQGR